MMLQLYLDVNNFFFLTTCLLGVLLLIFAFFDVNYFIRLAYVIYSARYQSKKKYKVSDTTEIKGICTTQDLDFVLKHMNNARFVRELDFARFHYYDQTGLYKLILRNKAHALQTACSIRYRRTIPLFTPYKITTKCLHWDEKFMYIEQQFVTVKDGFVRATVLSKQTVLNMNVVDALKELDPDFKPTLSEDLKLWIESMEASSKKLKKSD